MTTRHLLAGTALAAVLMLTAGPSMATTINLGGYSGPIQIKFQNYEAFTGTGTISPSNSNYGVISVTSIVGGPGFNTTLWTSGAPGDGFIAGVFDDVHVQSITGTSTAGSGLASGGNVALFLLSSNFNPTQGTGGYAAAGGGCTTNQLCYNGITNVGGDNVLNLALASGIDPADGTITLSSSFNLATLPFTGSSFAYMDITGGSAAGQFGRGGFPTTFGARDMFISEDFCVPGSAVACTPVGNWTFLSHDPVDASVVPEPSSLAVLGAALLGLGAFWRRRKKSS